MNSGVCNLRSDTRMYFSSGNIMVLFNSTGKEIPISIARKWLRNCFDDDSSDYSQMTYRHVVHGQEENLEWPWNVASIIDFSKWKVLRYQWREFQSFDIKWSSLTLTKIHKSYFKDICFSIKLWGQSFKYLTLITQSGNRLVNCHDDQSYSWFSATNWLSHALIGQFIFANHHPSSWPRWPRFTFGSGIPWMVLRWDCWVLVALPI